jgi:uncharacterized membrane protein
MNNTTLNRLLLLSSMVALLVMSFLFDLGTTALQIKNSEGVGLEPLLVVLFPVFEVIVVLGGMGLFWYLFTSPGRDRLIGWVYAVVGLLIVFMAPLLFFLPVPMTVYALVQYFTPGTFLIHAGGLLGVGGALSLVLMKSVTEEEEETDQPSTSLTEESEA